MIIETICQYPWQIVCGTAATLGGVGSGIQTYLKRKKENKKEKFDVQKFLDTLWQSALTGYGASFALGCGWLGILAAMTSAIGVDKIANKLNIKGQQVVNIVQMLAKVLTKVDKKKKR